MFDLEQSAQFLSEAKEVIKNAAKGGKVVLFVGTKDEVSKQVKEAAEKVGAPFVTHRWVGGMITNWGEVKKRINRLLDLIAQGESGELERKYTKKERVIINRELDKLINNFGGIRVLEKIPDMMMIIDPRHDHLAVKEANVKNIPIIAVASSDTNLNDVTYPITMNDSLRASVNLVLAELTASYEEGKKEFTPIVTDTVRRRRTTPRSTEVA